MKKYLQISLIILMVLVIVGCEGEKNNNGYKKETVVKENLSKDEESFLLDRIDNLKYIDFYGKSLKTQDLTNQEILQIINSTYSDLNNVSFNEIENKAIAYFNYYVNPEDILCDTHNYLFTTSEYLYNYDSDLKGYKFNTSHTGHKEVGVKTDVINKLKESYKENNIYTLVLYKAFSEILNSDNSNINNYYRNYLDAVNKSNLLFVGKNEFDKNIEQLSTYTYTFVKKDDNYYLKEYRIN